MNIIHKLDLNNMVMGLKQCFMEYMTKAVLSLRWNCRASREIMKLRVTRKVLMN